jgi:hypothetical protein
VDRRVANNADIAAEDADMNTPLHVRVPAVSCCMLSASGRSARPRATGALRCFRFLNRFVRFAAFPISQSLGRNRCSAHAIQLACMRGRRETAELLVDLRADVNARNAAGLAAARLLDC